MLRHVYEPAVGQLGKYTVAAILHATYLIATAEIHNCSIFHKIEDKKKEGKGMNEAR